MCSGNNILRSIVSLLLIAEIVIASPTALDRVDTCIKQLEKAFEGYKIPTSIETYAGVVSDWFTGETNKITDVKKNDLPKITADECDQHMDSLEDTLAKVPCDEELSTSDLVEEYELKMQESRILNKILLGSLICKDMV